ncbi:MAG TPA: N-6 DNA methylase [Nannocystaceae bacterium]|nr:N-6 DNA methylase [Nannocystaceae bacterium]
MSQNTRNIIGKLWSLCDVLRDDGITYHQYVTELSYLLFLKLAKETGTEGLIRKGSRWDAIVAEPALDRLAAYRRALEQLSSSSSKLVRAIFANATTSIRKPSALDIIVDEINNLDWYSEARLGDIYEGLLAKNAEEKKSGAGQYFTPRPLIDSMVALMKPSLDDIIQDPAAGTGGFLVAANRYIREHSDPGAWTEAMQRKYRRGTFYGMEHVQDTHRLALMNLLLHGIDAEPNGGGIRCGDTLSDEGAALPKATLILTNPPFGTKNGGGRPSRTDLDFSTSNKQFCFLQHVYLGLKPGGRAAVVVPDNVLFEGGVGKQIRTALMAKCNLHTILRLPTGIFYAQGVKTNVLFFTRGESDEDNTRSVWVYDLRSNIPTFGKRSTLTRAHFKDFERSFGSDPLGSPKSLSRRKDTGEAGRFRQFTREWIARRDESLDIAWLPSEDVADRGRELAPGELVAEIEAELLAALEEIRSLQAELPGAGEDRP